MALSYCYSMKFSVTGGLRSYMQAEKSCKKTCGVQGTASHCLKQTNVIISDCVRSYSLSISNATAVFSATDRLENKLLNTQVALIILL